jgi:galactofuranose transport system ATP-binding protein
MSHTHLLQMKAISKAFPGVQALKDVDLSVGYGEVHALMGENGAGKSTLIKILTGIYRRDAGEILFEDNPITPANAAQAQHLGISTIYQELNLLPHLSVCENIHIGREPKAGGFIDWRAARRKSRKILAGMGLGDIDVDEPLYRQSVAIQQMVAIARAVSIDASLLVMDEPTSSLSEDEIEVLFEVIEGLKQKNMSVIFISHKMGEVQRICDKVTILRDGSLVGEYRVCDLTKLEMVSLMIGRDAASVLERKKSASDGREGSEVVLSAKNVTRGRRTRGIDIDVRSGEILGIAGLLGSGRTEFARILFGADRPDGGEITIRDRRLHMKSPRDAIAMGLGFCSEARKEEGIFPNMSVMENMTMAVLPEVGRCGILSRKAQLRLAETYIAKLRITTSGPCQAMRELSGGNQQKVLLARWLCKKPILMILDEPTRGIDLGGKSEIESIIAEFAGRGMAIMMISSEVEELVRSCDRIAVLSEGRKVGELAAHEISEDSLVELIAHGHDRRQEAHIAP